MRNKRLVKQHLLQQHWIFQQGHVHVFKNHVKALTWRIFSPAETGSSCELDLFSNSGLKSTISCRTLSKKKVLFFKRLTFVLTLHFIGGTTAMWKPLSYVYAVFQWHQKALHHRKFQLLTVSDDHHVGAGQSWAQVIQMDPAVIGHQPQSKIWLVSFIRPKTMRQNSHVILLP